jgi:hypothetical protein
MFSGALSEKRLEKMGKIYVGKPLKTKTRKELLATLKPKMRQHLRPDTGDMPDEISVLTEKIAATATI